MDYTKVTQIKVLKLDERAILPVRKNSTDAGIDFYALEDTRVEYHDFAIVRTGISLEIPEGRCMLIKPKSKNNHLVGAGVVDAYYEPGEVLVKVANISDSIMFIKRGDPIAQGVLILIDTPELVEVFSIDDMTNTSERSNSGGILDQLSQEDYSAS